MSWIEKARSWFPSRAGSTAGGYVGGKVEKALKSSPESLADDPSASTNTEQLVGTAVVTTVCKFDSKSEPAIRKSQAALVAAAGTAQIRVADSERRRGEDVQRGRLRRLKEQDERERKTLDAPIDHAAPLVSHRVVTGAEILLGLVETGFWYLVFSASIDRRVSLLSSQRLSAIGLALFIPVLGVLAARLAGPAWQRALRYPASDKNLRRNQIVAAAVSTGLLVAAGGAAWFLVSWRYSKNNPSNTFAVLPPGWCMALLFVGSIMTLALLRAFSDSEQHAVNKTRDAAVVADHAAEKTTYDRLVGALVTWANEWTALRQLVNAGLNEVERIVATGEHILLYNRGRHADAPRTQTAKVADTSKETEVRYHLDVNLIATQLRVHASALQTLADYQPPTVRPDKQLLEQFPQSTTQQVNDLNERIKTLLGNLSEPGEPSANEAATNESSNKVAQSSEPPADSAVPSNPADEAITSAVLDKLLVTGINGHDRVSSTS